MPFCCFEDSKLITAYFLLVQSTDVYRVATLWSCEMEHPYMPLIALYVLNYLQHIQHVISMLFFSVITLFTVHSGFTFVSINPCKWMIDRFSVKLSRVSALSWQIPSKHQHTICTNVSGGTCILTCSHIGTVTHTHTHTLPACVGVYIELTNVIHTGEKWEDGQSVHNFKI